MAEKVWKLAWNPSGYTYNNVLVDTSSQKIGEFISLDHTFFCIKGISVTNSKGAFLTVSDTDSKADILLTSYQPYLSKVSNIPVFRNMMLNSKKSLGKLSLTITFIADELNPDDLGQKLNENADVIHNSISTLYSDSIAEYTQFLGVSDFISLPNEGYISERCTKFNTKDFYINETQIDDKKLSFQSDDFKIKGNKGGISYNGKTGYISRYSPSLKRDLPLLSLSDSTPTFNKFLVVNPNDPSTLKTINWLSLETHREGISLPHIKVDEIESTDIKIGGFNIKLDDNGNLNINNSIIIDENNNVNIGSIKFNREFYDAYMYLLELKNRGK